MNKDLSFCIGSLELIRRQEKNDGDFKFALKHFYYAWEDIKEYTSGNKVDNKNRNAYALNNIAVILIYEKYQKGANIWENSNQLHNLFLKFDGYENIIKLTSFKKIGKSNYYDYDNHRFISLIYKIYKDIGMKCKPYISRINFVFILDYLKTNLDKDETSFKLAMKTGYNSLKFFIFGRFFDYIGRLNNKIKKLHKDYDEKEHFPNIKLNAKDIVDLSKKMAILYYTKAIMLDPYFSKANLYLGNVINDKDKSKLKEFTEFYNELKDKTYREENKKNYNINEVLESKLRVKLKQDLDVEDEYVVNSETPHITIPIQKLPFTFVNKLFTELDQYFTQ